MAHKGGADGSGRAVPVEAGFPGSLRAGIIYRTPYFGYSNETLIVRVIRLDDVRKRLCSRFVDRSRKESRIYFASKVGTTARTVIRRVLCMLRSGKGQLKRSRDDHFGARCNTTSVAIALCDTKLLAGQAPGDTNFPCNGKCLRALSGGAELQIVLCTAVGTSFLL